MFRKMDSASWLWDHDVHPYDPDAKIIGGTGTIGTTGTGTGVGPGVGVGVILGGVGGSPLRMRTVFSGADWVFNRGTRLYTNRTTQEVIQESPCYWCNICESR